MQHPVRRHAGRQLRLDFERNGYVDKDTFNQRYRSVKRLEDESNQVVLFETLTHDNKYVNMNEFLSAMSKFTSHAPFTSPSLITSRIVIFEYGGEKLIGQFSVSVEGKFRKKI